ncbi:MAG: ribosome biogenesis GTP-binding protein YihA/YsxC [Desulfomonilaceae bacterium]
MRIHTADFLVGAESPEQYPRSRLPEVAFAGRSNVGKSSMMNCLLGRKNLVKVSKTPGRTRKLNFFLINGQFIFVDLPGYGYAVASRQERHKWASMVTRYLEGRRELAGVVVVVDARHAPMDIDVAFLEYLGSLGMAHIVVCTKIDRLPRSRILAQSMIWKSRLAHGKAPIMFSAHTAEGKSELWKALTKMIGGREFVEERAGVDYTEDAVQKT